MLCWLLLSLQLILLSHLLNLKSLDVEEVTLTYLQLLVYKIVYYVSLVVSCGEGRTTLSGEWSNVD